VLSLHLGWTPSCSIPLGHSCRENFFAEEKMEVMVDELIMNQQCALTVKVIRSILECFGISVDSRSKQVIVGPLFSTRGNISGILYLF